jgi:hypothetical protein
MILPFCFISIFLAILAALRDPFAPRRPGFRSREKVVGEIQKLPHHSRKFLPGQKIPASRQGGGEVSIFLVIFAA